MAGRPSNRFLWTLIAIGPVLWSIDTLAAIAIDQASCAVGRPTNVSLLVPLLALSIVAIVVVVGIALTGRWKLAAEGLDTGFGETEPDRRRFMLRVGVTISGLTLVAMVFRMVTVFFVPARPC